MVHLISQCFFFVSKTRVIHEHLKVFSAGYEVQLVYGTSVVLTDETVF